VPLAACVAALTALLAFATAASLICCGTEVIASVAGSAGRYPIVLL
jgi:hypothetical protein